MTFDFDTAKKNVSNYSYLIGHDISKDLPNYKIQHIVIAPFDDNQFKTFIRAFNQNENYESSLLSSSFDKSKVKVLLIHLDKWKGDIFYFDIDKFLTETGIEKIY